MSETVSGPSVLGRACASLPQQAPFRRASRRKRGLELARRLDLHGSANWFARLLQFALKLTY
jgi:hypothetical protein